MQSRRPLPKPILKNEQNDLKENRAQLNQNNNNNSTDRDRFLESLNLKKTPPNTKPVLKQLNKPKSVDQEEENYSDGRYSDDDDAGDDKNKGRRGSHKNRDTNPQRHKTESSDASDRDRSSSKSVSRETKIRPKIQLKIQPKKRDLKEAEYGWKNLDTLDSVPPSDYTITHVNQNHDLLRLGETKVAPHMNLSSTEWLKNYGLETMQLGLKDLLSKGAVTKSLNLNI